MCVASVAILAQVAWRYGSDATMAAWIPGVNCPSIGRGGDRRTGHDMRAGMQAHQLLGNLLTNLRKVSAEELRGVCSLFVAGGVSIQWWTPVGFVAGLAGLPVTTVQTVEARRQAPGGVGARERSRPRAHR